VRKESETRVRRKKIKASEKVETPRNFVFPMFWGAGGLTSRLAKAAVVEPSGGLRNEQLHNEKLLPLWCETHVQVKT
jgi:hypothetical protein